MAKKERAESQVEGIEKTPFTQTPTIRDAVTYIVDEQGNEVVAKDSQSAERRAQSEEEEKK